MHKYVKRQAKIQEKSQQRSEIGKVSALKAVQTTCERGLPLSQESLNKFLEEAHSIQEKQSIIYELLMYKKFKIVEKLISKNKVKKSQLIDSSPQIKLLYESQSNVVRKNPESQKQVKKKDLDQSLTSQMSKKDKFLNAVKRQTQFLRKVRPQYYALVISLILAAILVKKYRTKIISVLKIIFNL